jgi:hypothetical protein
MTTLGKRMIKAAQEAHEIVREMGEHPVGHNNPPEPTPFEAVKQEIEDLFLEATNWADGEPITSDAQDTEVSYLIGRIRDAEKRAEALRVAEKKPLDEQVKQIQERYNGLIADKKGKTWLALDALKKVLAPWLKAKADALAEQQRLARQEADRIAAAARAAVQTSAPTDLAARAAAEDLVQAAKAAETAARRVENAKAQSTGGTRAIGLRNKTTVELVDAAAALRYYRTTRPEALKAWLVEQATADAAAKILDIPGFTYKTEQVAQ